MLTRKIGLRVINISASGCLVEMSRRMEVGTVGTLRLQIGEKEYSDDVQVVRCQPIAGAGSVYHVGLTFLSTTRRHRLSIRHVIARHAADVRGGRLQTLCDWLGDCRT